MCMQSENIVICLSELVARFEIGFDFVQSFFVQFDAIAALFIMHVRMYEKFFDVLRKHS